MTNMETKTHSGSYNTKSERGRSILEILGTLAIIGVLSIVGIKGYSFMREKHNVAQTVHDIRLRTSTILLQKQLNREVDLDVFPVVNSVGYTIVYKADTDSLQVAPIPKKECQAIFEALIPEMIIAINGKQHNAYKEVCSASNAMDFYIGMDKRDFVPDPCPDGTSLTGLGGYAVTKEGKKCYCSEIDMIYKSSTCTPKPAEGCKNNNECNGNEYCNLPVYTGADCPSATITSAFRGECRVAANDLREKPESAPFYVSSNTQTWQSASNFCSALGKKMVSLSDWECGKSICNSGCDCKDSCACKTADSSAVSPIITQMSGYGSFNGWVTNKYSSCYYYSLNKSGGYVGSTEKTKYGRHAICKD